MDTLPPNENVRIIFTGLLVFFPILNGQCRIAILRESGHQFRIEVEEDDVPIRTLTSEVGVGDIGLDVTNPKAGIPLLETFTKPGFQHQQGVDDDQDYGWLLELDALGGQPHPRPGINLRNILLKNGILHSAGLSKVDVAQTAGPPRHTFMAEFVAANIYLSGPESKVTLTFGQAGTQSLLINRNPAARYVVRMLNNPPDGMDHMGHEAPGTTIITDFHFYYDFFDVPTADQRQVLFKVPEGGGHGTPGHPCGPGQ